MNTLFTAWVGLDIAKQTFEACLRRPEGKPQNKAFDNAPAGFAKLLRWIENLAPGAHCHFCMEATGAYGNALATFLVEAGQAVSVVNPCRTRHAAIAYGQDNKTDPVDARTLAQYCQKEQPALWRQSAPEVRLLLALMRRLDALETQRQQEQNRRSEPGLLEPIVRSLETTLAFLNTEIGRLEQEIAVHIDQHPSLKGDRDLLLSIPGVGEKTARWILAELPDVSQFADAQAASAYAGLAPREYRSGTSVKRATRLSKRGNVHLRKALYFPAMTAVRFNPLVKALYDRLIAAGRPRMVALGAAMRKVLMLCFGVLKNQREFTLEPLKNRA
jgi:transposase